MGWLVILAICALIGWAIGPSESESSPRPCYQSESCMDDLDTYLEDGGDIVELCEATPSCRDGLD